jgi:hypothetical protein
MNCSLLPVTEEVATAKLRHRVDTERVVGPDVDWLLLLSPYPQFPL